MRHLIVAVAVAMLAGCGVETATTAATGASIKKQEVEEGKRTQDRAHQKIDQMQEQMQQRAQQAREASDK
jgi:polyhydroxyalkanoate synthesis regulator phasin